MPSPDQLELPLIAAIPGDDHHEVLLLGRGAALPSAAPSPVHELVAELARAHPRHPAVWHAGRMVDYGAIVAWAGRTAAQLGAAGIGTGCRVGVLIEPSAAMVAAVLGILQSGAAYVPVDPAQPDTRIATILSDARVAGAVVTAGTETRLAGLGLPLVRADDADGPISTAVAVSADDIAYLIYTSGSTGEPKGVLVGHGHLAASTLARRAVYPGAPVFLLVSPLAFDSSVAGLWGTLTTGGCLVVADSDDVRDPERLVALIDEHQVTRLLCIPSLYGLLLDAADRLGAERLRSLDCVIVAGEALPEALVTRHFGWHTHPVALVNEYGPTEATVWASYQWLDAPGPASIGGPVPGANLYVLDERLRPVPRGVEGELFIGGAGVSHGYFGRPEATAWSFIEDPFAIQGEGARMYRTGDLVRWNDAGTLDFLGRRDHQVKIRGHRVELGAVESMLLALPGVRDAAVVPDQDRTQLTGFVTSTGDTTPETIRAQLAERLPSAMVPARIRVLDRLPQTISGKVDRAALSAVVEEPLPTVAVGADGGMIAQVAAAWTQVLKVAQVPADVNFFDLGGNSLTMYHLQDALESHTGTRPSVVSLFKHTTVSAQATLIRDGGAGPEESVTGMRDAAARRAQALRARQQRAEREASK